LTADVLHINYEMMLACSGSSVSHKQKCLFVKEVNICYKMAY